MNKLFIIISILVAVTTRSCSPSQRVDNNPIDISQFVAEYERAEKDSAFNDSMAIAEMQEIKGDSLATTTDIAQGLCCSAVCWTDIEPGVDGNNLLKNAALLYNVCALANSVYSDFEIWERSQEIGVSLVAEDSVIAAISRIDVNVISNAEYRKEAKRYRDGLVWCMKNVEKLSEDYNPNIVSERYDSLVTGSLAYMLLDSATYCHYDNIVDSIIGLYKPVQQEVAKQSSDKRFREMCNRIQKAKSFDEQCGILLACSSKPETNKDVWSTKLMKVLMESGRYSVLLGRMWAMWRAFSQVTYCGLSHDSCIPNYTYDKMRKKVYETMIGYIESNPGNKDAVANAVVLATNIRLVRNGRFVYGNDAPMEILSYCPDYYGNMDENDSTN